MLSSTPSDFVQMAEVATGTWEIQVLSFKIKLKFADHAEFATDFGSSWC